MSDVAFCDSMGLKALLAARNAAVQAGAAFDIVAASAQVAHLLEIVGLPSTLHADPHTTRARHQTLADRLPGA